MVVVLVLARQVEVNITEPNFPYFTVHFNTCSHALPSPSPSPLSTGASAARFNRHGKPVVDEKASEIAWLKQVERRIKMEGFQKRFEEQRLRQAEVNKRKERRERDRRGRKE